MTLIDWVGLAFAIGAVAAIREKLRMRRARLRGEQLTLTAAFRRHQCPRD